MPNSLRNSSEGIDLATVDDPDVRRVLRQMNDRITATLGRQQMEIEALLEMMIDKHIGSLGEFKRYLAKLQEGNQRTERIHEEVLSAAGISSRSVRLEA
jgi:hypothetical protein